MCCVLMAAVQTVPQRGAYKGGIRLSFLSLGLEGDAVASLELEWYYGNGEEELTSDTTLNPFGVSCGLLIPILIPSLDLVELFL